MSKYKSVRLEDCKFLSPNGKVEVEGVIESISNLDDGYNFHLGDGNDLNFNPRVFCQYEKKMFKRDPFANFENVENVVGTTAVVRGWYIATLIMVHEVDLKEVDYTHGQLSIIQKRDLEGAVSISDLEGALSKVEE